MVSGKPKSEGSPRSVPMSIQVSPGVVRPVDAAVELHVERRRLARRTPHVVDAKGVRVLARFFRDVPRHQAADAAAPAFAGVVGEPDPGRGDADRQAVRVARPGADRVEAQPAGAGLPLRPLRARSRGPPRAPSVLPPSPAPEQRRRCDAAPDDVIVNAGLDDPDPLDGRVGAGRERQVPRPAAISRSDRRYRTDAGRTDRA